MLYKAEQRLRGVSVKVRKNRSREILPSTFLHQSRAGNLNVNERIRRGSSRVGRLPIHPRFGPTVLGVFEGAKIDVRELADLHARFLTTASGRIDYLLQKNARR